MTQYIIPAPVSGVPQTPVDLSTLGGGPAPAGTANPIPGLDGQDGVEGERGPPGERGATGAAGSAGGTGAMGPAGLVGPPGMEGMDGLDGFDGAPGPTGPAGGIGPQGSPGNTGATGPMGVLGPPGWDGADGIDGDFGIPGPPGATGAAGSPGSPGSPGATGSMGPIGAPGFDGQDGADSWEPGPPGQAGPAGPTGPPGGGGGSATTMEANLGAVPVFRGKFTITDAAITSSKKILCWQAPGPYTGKGTQADEAEMAPVQIIAVTPATGTASVSWQTPPILAAIPYGLSGGDGGRANTVAAATGRRTEFDIVQNQRVNLVMGNIKFTYMVL